LNLIKRALKNLWRSPLRTAMVVIILSVSTGLALTMLTIYGASQNQINNIVSELDTAITVRPAGSFGFLGGDATISAENVTAIEGFEHITDIQKTITSRYTGDELVAAANDEVQMSPPPGSDTQLPSMPPGGTGMRLNIGIIALGGDPTSAATPALFGGASIENITAGRYFNQDESNADAVIIGTGLAEANSLAVGDTFDIEGTPVEIVGIFETGQRFGNNMMLLPTETVMRLFGLAGYTELTVTVDNVDNVATVAAAIKETLGEDVVDVTTPDDRFNVMNSSLERATQTSQIGTIAAIAVAVVVIVVAIVLTMRQRVKEVGILKAIGASNWHITLGFGIETLVISLLSVAIGMLMTIPLAGTVSRLLVTTPTTVGRLGGMGGGLPSGGGFITRGEVFGARTAIAGIDVAVSPEILLYAIGLAVLLAVAASIFPSWYIARIKPAEVLRSE